MLKSLALASLLGATLACCQCSVAHAASKTVTLSVSNMYCATCPVAVKKALSRVEGVEAVDVDFKQKRATVTFDDAKTAAEALTQATANAGFPSTLTGGASK